MIRFDKPYANFRHCSTQPSMFWRAASEHEPRLTHSTVRSKFNKESWFGARKKRRTAAGPKCVFRGRKRHGYELRRPSCALSTRHYGTPCKVRRCITWAAAEPAALWHQPFCQKQGHYEPFSRSRKALAPMLPLQYRVDTREVAANSER